MPGSVDINYDVLYDLGGQVVNLVPDSEKYNYRWWRGAHLGAMALRLSKGLPLLTSTDEDGIHFYGADYYYPLRIAKNIAEEELSEGSRTFSRGFEPEERRALSELSGRSVDTPLPSILFALDAPHNDLTLSTTTMGIPGIRKGHMLAGDYSTDAMDPYSRAFIEGELIK